MTRRELFLCVIGLFIKPKPKAKQRKALIYAAAYGGVYSIEHIPGSVIGWAYFPKRDNGTQQTKIS